MWKNRNNGNKQAYKQKQKSQIAGIHHMVCMENGRTIKHGLLSENHIKCKTGRKIVMKKNIRYHKVFYAMKHSKIKEVKKHNCVHPKKQSFKWLICGKKIATFIHMNKHI